MNRIEEVLDRINKMVKGFEGTPDTITLPLQATVGADWGFGIHCAKGVWVTECDPEIAEQVLEEFSKLTQEQTK